MAGMAAAVATAAAIVLALAIGTHGHHGGVSRAATGATNSTLPRSAASPSPTPTTVAANTTGSVPSGFPEGNQSAIIAVNPGNKSLTLDSNNQDVTYHICSSFTAFVGGKQLSLTGISPGEFTVVDVDLLTRCVKSVKVIPPPEPPSCSAVGFDGVGTVAWEGFSIPGHSILYRATGPDEPILAVRWCGAPTVSTQTGRAATLSGIKVGTSVQLTFSGGAQGQWLRSLVAQGA